jgi:hypothetical protein
MDRMWRCPGWRWQPLPACAPDRRARGRSGGSFTPSAAVPSRSCVPPPAYRRLRPAAAVRRDQRGHLAPDDRPRRRLGQWCFRRGRLLRLPPQGQEGLAGRGPGRDPPADRHCQLRAGAGRRTALAQQPAGLLRLRGAVRPAQRGGRPDHSRAGGPRGRRKRRGALRRTHPPPPTAAAWSKWTCSPTRQGCDHLTRAYPGALQCAVRPAGSRTRVIAATSRWLAPIHLAGHPGRRPVIIGWVIRLRVRPAGRRRPTASPERRARPGLAVVTNS